MLGALAGPAAGQSADASPGWRLDREEGDRLTLRATLTPASCPGWAQGLSRFGTGRVIADRMVGVRRLVRVSYDDAGVEAECLGGLALLTGPAARLRDLVD